MDVSPTEQPLVRKGSTAREDAAAMAMEASGAFDDMDMTADGESELVSVVRDGFVQALEMDRSCALAWYKLGSMTSRDEPVELPFSVPKDGHEEPADVENAKDASGAKCVRMAPLECTRRALNIALGPDGGVADGWSIADAFYNLALDLRHRANEVHDGARRVTKTTAHVAGEDITWVEAFRRALERDSGDAAKWIEAAQAIDDDEDTDGSVARTLVVDGFGKLTARDMYVRVATGRLFPVDGDKPLKLADVAAEDRLFAWQCAGVSLSALSVDTPATVDVPTLALPKVDAVAALSSEPVFKALQMFKWPRAVDGNVPFTAKECIQAALAVQPLNARLWVDLAKHVIDRLPKQFAAMEADGSSAEAVGLPAETLSPLECLAAALELDADEADTWTLLASCLEAGMGRERPTLTVRGKPLSRWMPRDCLVEAVQRDPRRAEAWYNLAMLSSQGATLAIPPNEARVYTAQECLKEALELQPDWSQAWARLGHTFVTLGQTSAAHSRISVAGETYHAKEAFARAVELDASNGMAWAGLAFTLGDNETVTIRGKELGREDCVKQRNATGGSGDALASDSDE